MKRFAVGAFVFVVLVVAFGVKASAGFFGPDPCVLNIPRGPFTYDTAATLYNQALRHEGNGADISTLSKEDYEHAAKLVADCRPQ